MDISIAQSELRRACVHGGPGTLVSGMVWLAAAITKNYAGVPTGFVVLFFRGMLIFPAAKRIVTACCRRQPESPENPGNGMVLETVFPMIGGLFSERLILPYRPEFFSHRGHVRRSTRLRIPDSLWRLELLALCGIMCSIGIASIL